VKNIFHRIINFSATSAATTKVAAATIRQWDNRLILVVVKTRLQRRLPGAAVVALLSRCKNETEFISKQNQKTVFVEWFFCNFVYELFF